MRSRKPNEAVQEGSHQAKDSANPDERLTNRWSAAKLNTKYKYDPVANLTNIDYNASTDVQLRYFAGLKKDEIIAKYGEPSERTATPFDVIYHYTRPGKSGTYRMRQVHFDAMSRVVSTLAAVYHD